MGFNLVKLTTFFSQGPRALKKLYLIVSVFSTRVLIGDTIFASLTGDGTAILRGHSGHAKV